jgi:hypothetical protein
MKSIQRHLVLATLTLSGIVGCQAVDAPAASELEPVDDVSQPLQETTCTVAPTFAPPSTPLTGTPPTSCGVYQEFSASSSSYKNNNADTCPFQFVVEVARSNNASIGSGYFFEGVPYVGQILSPDGGKTQCERKQASYAAWSFSGGVWTLVGEIWVKGRWFESEDTLFPCTYSKFSGSGSLNTVPATATKLRIAASEWVESGSKGADGGDTYHSVTAGIGAGHLCPF